jgi:dTDP-4-dehydrorhamnose 3,5-epimerase
MAIHFISTEIPDIVIVRPQVFRDERGFFMETYNREQFAEAGIPTDFVQDNHSASSQFVLRGLHYQIQHPQGKLVRVIQGEVFDVSVDIRRSSSTFGKWVGVVLSADCKDALWVPPGFAHGFLVLSEKAEFTYKVTDFYAPEWERSILWNDPEIGIEWPLPAFATPVLSPKDAAGQPLKLAEVYP